MHIVPATAVRGIMKKDDATRKKAYALNPFISSLETNEMRPQVSYRKAGSRGQVP